MNPFLIHLGYQQYTVRIYNSAMLRSVQGALQWQKAPRAAYKFSLVRVVSYEIQTSLPVSCATMGTGGGCQVCYANGAVGRSED